MVNQQDTRSQIGSVYEKSRGFPFFNFYRSLQTVLLYLFVLMATSNVYLRREILFLTDF